MGHLANNMMTIEAEVRVPVATGELVQFHLPEPADVMHTADVYRLDLCLTPAAQCACILPRPLESAAL